MIPYTYIFIRKDLPTAYMMVQACHACLELPKVPKETHVCLLGVKNENELIKVSEDLKQKGIMFEMFFEPDYSTGFTSIATEPIYGSRRNGFKKYKLLKL